MRSAAVIALLFTASCTVEFPPIDELRCRRDGWWDESFPERHAIEVSAEVSLPEGYELSLAVAGLSSSPRVVSRREDGTCGPIARFVETSYATLWFAWPGSDVDRLWLYQGNTTVSSPATPASAIFTYAEDFAPGYEERWTVSPAAAAQANPWTQTVTLTSPPIIPDERELVASLSFDFSSVGDQATLLLSDAGGSCAGLSYRKESSSPGLQRYLVTRCVPGVGEQSLGAVSGAEPLAFVRSGGKLWYRVGQALEPVAVSLVGDARIHLSLQLLGEGNLYVTRLRARHYLVPEPVVTLGELERR
jgi:hypothetical protein